MRKISYRLYFMSNKTIELKSAPNIGPKILERLQAVGIHSLPDLKKTGAPLAFVKIQKKFSKETIPRCYYLYSLEGALQQTNWRELSESTKKKLNNKVDKL